MSALSPVLRSSDGGRLSFFCPGCREPHSIEVGNGRWTWNGNAERPTFAPSILVRSGHYASGFDPTKDACWCSYNQEHPEDRVSFACAICHSFVRDGQIQFLGDCTHELAGKTVRIPDWPLS